MNKKENVMKKRKVNWLNVTLLVCLIVFLVSGFFLIKDIYTSSKEKNANNLLSDIVKDARKNIDGIDVNTENMKDVYQSLYEQNNDMAAWIYIEGTGLDYPVMYTPNNPEFYLRRAFDKTYANSGSLFISDGCEPDGNHVIIYGHNMKNGTMFGYLMNYDSYDYFETHPYIEYDTLTHQGKYAIMSVFYTEIFPVEEKNVFRYYQYTDLSEQSTFDYYIAAALSSSLYDTGVTAEYGERILTLSTCSYHKENGRFVVIAKEVTDE